MGAIRRNLAERVPIVTRELTGVSKTCIWLGVTYERVNKKDSERAGNSDLFNLKTKIFMIFGSNKEQFSWLAGKYIAHCLRNLAHIRVQTPKMA